MIIESGLVKTGPTGLVATVMSSDCQMSLPLDSIYLNMSHIGVKLVVYVEGAWQLSSFHDVSIII